MPDTCSFISTACRGAVMSAGRWTLERTSPDGDRISRRGGSPLTISTRPSSATHIVNGHTMPSSQLTQQRHRTQQAFKAPQHGQPFINAMINRTVVDITLRLGPFDNTPPCQISTACPCSITYRVYAFFASSPNPIILATMCKQDITHKAEVHNISQRHQRRTEPRP